MGSRAQVAAAACLLASGLLVGGGLGTANADPGQTAGDGTSGHTTDDASSPVRESDAATSDTDRDLDSANSGRPPTDTDAVVRDKDPADDPAAVGGSEMPPEGGLDVPGGAVDGADGEKEPLPPCCDGAETDCWPWPHPGPDDPSESDNGGGFPGGLPVGVPFPPPSIGVPPEFVPPVGEPISPEVVDTVPGVEVTSSGFTGAPVSVPVLVTFPTGLGVGPTGGGAGPVPPAAPRRGSAEPARQRLPATAGSTLAMPASSYRVGYTDYLRTAGMSQIAVLAVPGLAGILLLTAAGGLIGYRQAEAGRAVSTSGIARYMN